MNAKIYVDNPATATTENDLKRLFSRYGNVTEINILLDHASRRPRGFGFITMATSEGARSAIQALNGKAIGNLYSYRERNLVARRACQPARWSGKRFVASPIWALTKQCPRVSPSGTTRSEFTLHVGHNPDNGIGAGRLRPARDDYRSCRIP